MALPQISGYRYTPANLTNTVEWTLDPARAVLLVHDMQQYFINAFDRSDSSAQINVAINSIAALIAAAREQDIPVVFSAQPPRQTAEKRALLTDFWGTGLQSDEAAAIIEELQAQESELLTKWRYSAFAHTDLREQMKSWGRDQLLITGVYAHIGCMTTTLDAFMHETQPFFIHDALADFSLEKHQMACDYVASRCGLVCSTQQALDQLGRGTRVRGAA